MSKNNNGGGGTGIGFTGVLQVAFIVLKLLDKIQWSWLWVLAPTWISAILFVVVIIWVAVKYK